MHLTNEVLHHIIELAKFIKRYISSLFSLANIFGKGGRVMANYVTCPNCGGAIIAPNPRGTTNVLCKHCRKWIKIQNGVPVGKS